MHQKMEKKAIELIGNNTTAGKLTKQLPQIKEDLANYFEGLSLKTVEFILREFQHETLRNQSILTVEKT